MRASTIQTTEKNPGYYAAETRTVTTHIREYEDMGDLLSVAEQVNEAPAINSFGSESKHGSWEFTGTSSLGSAIALARDGWPEGRHHITEEMKNINVPELIGRTVLPVPFFDEAGQEPDVGRWLSGESDCMIDYSFPSTPTGNIVELVINRVNSAYVSQDSIIRKGASIVAATERLQMGGYSVGVTLGYAVGSSPSSYATQRLETYVPVFKPGQAMNLDSLCFGMAHPSFGRRLIFASQETEAPDIRRTFGFTSGGGYGYPVSLQHLPEANHPQVVIEYGHSDKGGAAAAQEIINRAVVAAQTALPS